MRFGVLLPLVCLVVAGTTGCGGGRVPETVTASGVVTWKGDPLPEGMIVFRPAEGVARSEATQIEDGRFTVAVPPGAKKVEITARREVPGKFDTSNPGERVPITEQYIPSEYNESTTLTADVSTSRDDLEFALDGM